MAERRFVLSADTARALRRMIDAGERGNTPRPPATARALGLMPGDCKIVRHPESGEARLMVCVDPAAAAGVDTGGATSPTVQLITEAGAEALDGYGDAVLDGWYSVGPFARGATAYLIVVVPAADYTRLGEAAAFGTSATRRYAIRSTPTAPDGWRMIASIPPAPICTWTDAGLRLYQRGALRLWSSRVDADVTRAERTAYAPDTRSIDGTGGAFRRLYEFATPTVIGNPYAQQSTAPADREKILVLVREKNNAGDVATLRYISLADFAAGDNGTPGAPDGLADLLDDQAQREGLPCPADGKGDIVFWDPCAQAWRSLRGNSGALEAITDARYWRSGGDATTCYGSAIGDADKVPRIVIPAATTGAPLRLVGDAVILGYVQPYDGIRAGVQATASLYEQTLSFDDGTSVKIAASAPPASIAAASTVAALEARVAALEAALANNTQGGNA